LLDCFGHKVERGAGDRIAGAYREMAQLVGALPPIFCSVEGLCHAPETGTRSRMFPPRAVREIPPNIRDLLPFSAMAPSIQALLPGSPQPPVHRDPPFGFPRRGADTARGD
jgi:hypothetical protein